MLSAAAYPEDRPLIAEIESERGAVLGSAIAVAAVQQPNTRREGLVSR
jgi:hypothetical protein